MASRPANAPGCFGIGIASMMNSKLCKACPAAKECSGDAVESLQKVSELLDVKDYLAIHSVTPRHTEPTKERYYPSKKLKLAKPSKDQVNMMMTMPVKARKVMNTIVKRNLQLGQCLKTKINPFKDTTPRYLESAFDVLLNQSTFTRHDLKSKYDCYDWNAGTVRSAVSEAISVFKGLNLITETQQNTFEVRS